MMDPTRPEFLRVPAISVVQPLGKFYAAAIPAGMLLQVCYTDRLTAYPDGKTYRLYGSQRSVAKARLRDIGRYIDTTESAFPNSVILAANYNEEDGLIIDSPDLKWGIEARDGSKGCLELVIPTSTKLAPIIDGQHRLFGFTEASPDRLETPVLCSIFLDLPRPYQAYLFATINSTQKPVDRSQTYELFGYNIDEEPAETWSPEKLAVFLARKLNTDVGSPLLGRILVAAENDFAISRADAKAQGRWMVSTATIVDGITRLISSSPKKDADALRTGSDYTRAKLPLGGRSVPPLRRLYLEVRDKVLLSAVSNFFGSLLSIMETDLSSDSYLTKTVGMQALFDVLRVLAPLALKDKDFSREWFASKLTPIADVDFSDDAFKQASGQGRTMIKNAILVHLDLPNSLEDERKTAVEAVLASAKKT